MVEDIAKIPEIEDFINDAKLVANKFILTHSKVKAAYLRLCKGK